MIVLNVRKVQFFGALVFGVRKVQLFAPLMLCVFAGEQPLRWRGAHNSDSCGFDDRAVAAMNVELLLVVESQCSTNYGATAYVYGCAWWWLGARDA